MPGKEPPSCPDCRKHRMPGTLLLQGKQRKSFFPFSRGWNQWIPIGRIAFFSLRGTLPKYCSESGMGSPPAADHTEGPYAGSLYENLLIYFVYRYWMKSFYDGELLPKAKLAVTGFLLFRLLNDTEPSFEGAVQNAKAFSKEVEYSDENLDALYTAAWQEDFLSLPALFTLLLSGK